MRSALLPVMVIVSLSGCVHVDQTRIRPGVYYVDAQGTESISRIRLVEEFHTRARQLCGTAGYEFKTDTGSEETDGGQRYNVTGYVECKDPAAAEMNSQALQRRRR